MTWFYNSYSGKLVHEDPPDPGYYVYEGALHTATGWHELNVAPDATESVAAAAASKIAGATPTTDNNPIPLAENATGQAASKAESTVGSLLGSFTIGGVSGTNLVQRALKIIVGGVLVLFGVVHLTGASGQVASTVRKVPLPV